jgi:fibro-slime domain-containing protein
VFSVFKPLLLALALALFVQCGARTGLDSPDACAPAGLVRSCQNSCGVGNQTCTDGLWQACSVPALTRPCSGVCGAGVQTCEADKLSACSIPVATRSCSNDCGAGQETCQNEAWQGCVVPVAQRDCSSVCGMGHEVCNAGTWGACDAPLPKPPVLHTTVRDFRKTQTDFELPLVGNVDDRGMVESVLGPDQKPVYAGNPTTRTTPTGEAGFDVWYRDTPGVNESLAIDLQLTEARGTPGLYAYDRRPFFPIDNQLYGNEGLAHNYHFTLETHTSFFYRGGETFSFAGDDDVWVFIANQLAIDLGGVHSLESASVRLDVIARPFGLVVGQRYALDLFFAERHTIDSDFTVRTTLADVGSCQ